MGENRKTPQEYMKQYLIKIGIPDFEKAVENARNNNIRRRKEERLATAKKILLEDCGYDYDQEAGTQSFENKDMTIEEEIGAEIYSIYESTKQIEELGDNDKIFERQIGISKEKLKEYGYDYDEEMKIQNFEEERGDNMPLDDKLKGNSTAPDSKKTEKEGKSEGKYEINLLQARRREISKEISERLKKQNLSKDELDKLNLLKREQDIIRQEEAKIEKSVENLRKEINEANRIIKSTEGYTKKETKTAYSTRNNAFKEINRIETEALQRVDKKLEEIKANRTIEQAENTGKAGKNAETPESNKPEEKDSQSPKKDPPTVEPQEEAKNSTQNEQPSATKIDEEILRLEEELKQVAGRRAEAKRLDLDFEEMIYRSRYTELVERIHKLNSQKQQIEIQNKIAEKEQELNVLYQEVNDKKGELNSLYAQLKGKKIVQEPPKQEPPKQEPPEQEPPKQEPPEQEQPEQETPEQEQPQQKPSEQEPPKPKSPQAGSSKEGAKSTPPIKKESRLAKIGKGMAGFLGKWMMRFATLGSGIKNIWNKFWNWMNKETNSPQQRNIFSTPTMEYSEEKRNDINQIMSELTDVFRHNGSKGEEEVVEAERAGEETQGGFAVGAEDSEPKAEEEVEGGRAGEETQDGFAVGAEDNEPKVEEEVEGERAGEETQGEFAVENGKLKNVEMPSFLHGYKSEEVEDIETENEEEEIDEQGINRKSRWKEWKEAHRKKKEALKWAKKEEERREKDRERNFKYKDCEIAESNWKAKKIIEQAKNKSLKYSMKIELANGEEVYINPDGTLSAKPEEVFSDPEEVLSDPEEVFNNPWRDEEAAAKVGAAEEVEKLSEKKEVLQLNSAVDKDGSEVDL